MNADVIVIGLGAMGSAACYQLAKFGANVLGIDRYSPPHTLGSTHGDTRITRLAIGEGEWFVPFALRSHEIWRELEAETGTDLLTTTGGLIMSSHSEHSLHGNYKFLETTIEAAKKFRIEHRVLNSTEIAEEFPQFQLTGDEKGYFEYEAGFLRPENCVATQLELAEKLGASVHRNEHVLELEQNGNSVDVTTDKGTYSASQVIVSAGPWLTEFIQSVPPGLFKVYRQILYWFDVSQAFDQYSVGKFPIYIWSFGRWRDDYVYGFPAMNGPEGGLKVASESYELATSPEVVDRSVSDEESSKMFDTYVRGHLKDVSAHCVKSAVCLYTVTPNSNFVIHRLDENVILASPCSGHGFKHSAAIGETLAELALSGKTKIDIAPFAMDQFS
jgi:sarcosine oxidase